MAVVQKSLRAIFDKASEIEAGEERRAYLDEACNGDAPLRESLEELLRAQETAGGFLADPKRAGRASAQVTEREGDRIDRYKLLQKIGEGGCGVVYMAEQIEPVRRRVALKIIKLGMDTRSVIARFEAERQAVALMDHPSIAQVFDAGATDGGRPFFVMELVRGLKITDFCDQNHLSTTERLQLFIQVCQAVQHAHQKGVIHRDLKPSNILVTSNDGVPLPKVIDFGIAKATADVRLTDKTLFTRFEMFLGTPAYMSPEQAEFNARDVDTRTDVYSLGVLLYELLTGYAPFDSEKWLNSGIDAMRKAIRETEPTRPSTRLTLELAARGSARSGGQPGNQHGTTAPNPGATPESGTPNRRLLAKELIAQLRGDLDWIVIKALEKDRARRYQTAADFAADIQRHLDNEPVVARPPSNIYLLRKAFRRHRLAFSAGMGVAAALLLGMSASVWQAGRAKASELFARRTAYNSDMNLALQALAVNNLGRAQSLLRRQQPQPGQADLRNWEWRYLWSQTQPDDHEVLWHGTNFLETLSCSPDGRLIALETGDQVIITELASRNAILRLTDRRLPTFANHASLLAMARAQSPDTNAAVLWDTIGQREIRTFPQNGRVLKMAFTPDDQRLLIITEHASASGFWGERLIAAWDATNGKFLWQQSIGPRARTSNTVLAISPDGLLFAVAMAEGRFRVGEIADGLETLTVKATKESVTALAFAPDGNALVSGAGYTDSSIQLWDVHSGTNRGALEGHRSWVSSLVFTRDGQQLISAGGDQTIRRWDWTKRASTGVMCGHHREVNEIALLPDGRTLLSQSREGEVFLWDLEKTSDHSGNRLLRGAFVSAVFSADSKTILGAQIDGGLGLWDLHTLAEVKRWRENSPTNSTSVRPASDARSAALFTRGGNVNILDLQTDISTQIRTTNGEPIVEVVFTENGNYLVTIVQKLSALEAQIWSVREARPAGTFPLQSAVRNVRRFTAPTISNSILVADNDGLRLWDVEKPGEPPRFISDPGEFADFQTSPDQKLAAAAFGEGYVRLWDMATLRPVGSLRDFMLGAHSVAFSRDGKRLVAGSNGLEALKLWDLGTRQQVLTLSGEGQLFIHAAFSPDGRHLFGLNAAGTLCLWSAPSWEEIAAAEAKEKRQDRPN